MTDEKPRMVTILHARCADKTHELYRSLYLAGMQDFAQRLKDVYQNDKRYDVPNPHTLIAKLFDNIDNLLDEFKEELN